MSVQSAQTRGRPAVFLDRDGTIIEDRGHVSACRDIVFIPNVFDSLRRLHARFELFIVTNQSGVGLGLIRKESAELANRYVTECLRDEGVVIKKVYCCMHRRDDECDCIKPKPYFLHRAREEFGIDLSSSFVIGDHPHDVEFARNGGATGLYVLTGHGHRHLSQLPENAPVFADVTHAVQQILGNMSGPPAPDRMPHP